MACELRLAASRRHHRYLRRSPHGDEPALVGLKVPGVVISDPGCTGKTYPRFFEDVERLRQARSGRVAGQLRHGSITNLAHGLEQFVGPAEDVDTGFFRRIRVLAGSQASNWPLQCLGKHLPAQIFHSDLQTATAGWAFLNEVR